VGCPLPSVAQPASRAARRNAPPGPPPLTLPTPCVHGRLAAAGGPPRAATSTPFTGAKACGCQGMRRVSGARPALQSYHWRPCRARGCQTGAPASQGDTPSGCAHGTCCLGDVKGSPAWALPVCVGANARQRAARGPPAIGPLSVSCPPLPGAPLAPRRRRPHLTRSPPSRGPPAHAPALNPFSSALLLLYHQRRLAAQLPRPMFSPSPRRQRLGPLPPSLASSKTRKHLQAGCTHAHTRDAPFCPAPPMTQTPAAQAGAYKRKAAAATEARRHPLPFRVPRAWCCAFSRPWLACARSKRPHLPDSGRRRQLPSKIAPLNRQPLFDCRR
jgi:hypothetical protein